MDLYTIAMKLHTVGKPQVLKDLGEVESAGKVLDKEMTKSVGSVEDVFKKATKSADDLAKGITSSTKSSEAAFDGLTETTSKTKDAISELSTTTDHVSKSMKGSIDIVKKAFAPLIGVLSVGAYIKNAEEAQYATALLEGAVASTGAASGKTVKQLEDMASGLSKVSTFSEDAIKTGLSRLLTYTDITGDMFDKAAQSAVDMAQFLKIDVASAAEKVGNALNYPSLALGSLSKQGFRFTEEQKRLIVHFEETNQLAKAQEIILGELELAYEGAALKARQTLGGSIKYLQNQLSASLSRTTGETAALSKGFNFLGDHMEAIVGWAKRIATVGLAVYIGRWTTATYANIKALYANAVAARANMTAQLGMATATKTATAAITSQTAAARVAAGAMGVLRGAMAFMGGPIGVALAGVAAIWWAISRGTKAAREEAEKYTNTLSKLSASDLEAAIAGQKRDAEELQTKIDALPAKRPVKGGYAAAKAGTGQEGATSTRSILEHRRRQILKSIEIMEGLLVGKKIESAQEEEGVKSALKERIEWLTISADRGIDLQKSLAELRKIDSELTGTVEDGTVAIKDRIEAAKQLATVTNTLVRHGASHQQVAAAAQRKAMGGPVLTNITGQVDDESANREKSAEAYVLRRKIANLQDFSKRFGIALSIAEKEEIKALDKRATALETEAKGGMAKLGEALVPKVLPDAKKFVNEAQKLLDEAAKQIADLINESFARTIGDALYNSFNSIFDGRSLRNTLNEFGRTLAAGMGDVLTQVGMGLGATLVKQGKVMLLNAAMVKKFLQGLQSLNPFLMAAAGATLIAAGSALGAVGQGAGRGTAGAGAYREPRYAANADDITRIRIVSDSEAQRARIEPRRDITINMFSPSDPVTQRNIKEAIRLADRRG